jgi:hypothetical protein
MVVSKPRLSTTLALEPERVTDSVASWEHR